MTFFKRVHPTFFIIINMFSKSSFQGSKIKSEEIKRNEVLIPHPYYGGFLATVSEKESMADPMFDMFMDDDSSHSIHYHGVESQLEIKQCDEPKSEHIS